MRTLLTLVEQRRELVGDRTRFTNRLCNTLKQYYPQALEWFEQRDTVLFCDFTTRWPTLMEVQRARTTTLRAFFKAHNVRRAKIIEGRIALIKFAMPLTMDKAVVKPYRLQALVLIDQLRITLQAIDRFDKEIALLAPTLPDYVLFSELPWCGSFSGAPPARCLRRATRTVYKC
jgi:hypothetical protein